jgi:glycerophosphoryl diester phosphodiesterase
MINQSKEVCNIAIARPGRIAAGTRCQVISHRGFSSMAPENTLASVAGSIAVGADACEFDVRCTADGHVVLMHDAAVDRTTNGTGDISKMTLTQLQQLDAGAWKGSEYIGQKVPTLADALELMSPSAHHAVVEIKAPAAAEGVAALAQQYKMTHRVTALSDDPATLGKIEAIDRNIRRALLCTAFPDETKKANAQIDWLIDQAHKASAPVVDIDYRLVSRQLIATLHRSGIKVWVWTVNAPEIMNCLIEWNIDAIASDKPDLMKATLNTDQ